MWTRRKLLQMIPALFIGPKLKELIKITPAVTPNMVRLPDNDPGIDSWNYYAHSCSGYVYLEQGDIQNMIKKMIVTHKEYVMRPTHMVLSPQGSKWLDEYMEEERRENKFHNQFVAWLDPKRLPG